MPVSGQVDLSVKQKGSDVNTDILMTFSLTTGDNDRQHIAHLAGLDARGRTLREAVLNVFLMLPGCTNWTEKELRYFVDQSPDTYQKRLILNILEPERG